MATIGDELKVGRADILDFPEDTIRTILEMQKEGWRAQRSNRNHVMLFAPDGETKLGASRNASSGKYLGEELRKYNARQGKVVQVVEKSGTAQKWACPRPDCNKVFVSSEKLNVHINLDHEGKLQCPDCGEFFSRAASLGRHRQAKHGYVSQHYKARKRHEAKRIQREKAIDRRLLELRGGPDLEDLLPVVSQPEPWTETKIETKVDPIDFIDERDSWSIDLQPLQGTKLFKIQEVLNAAGLEMEIRVWKR